jgi:hypothetical protein
MAGDSAIGMVGDIAVRSRVAPGEIQVLLEMCTPASGTTAMHIAPTEFAQMAHTHGLTVGS